MTKSAEYPENPTKSKLDALEAVYGSRYGPSVRPSVRISSIAPCVLLTLACHQPPSPASTAPTRTDADHTASAPHAPNTPVPASKPLPTAAPSDETRAPREPNEPNGNGAPDDPGPALSPPPGHWERIGRHWGSLSRICDLQPFGGALYAAHGTKPLGWDGASITRYVPDAKAAFELAFDWNRPGEPSKGGGGGQGFLRLQRLHDRLFTPDADPPYLGLGMKSGIEGYVFVSDATGRFAPSRRPHHRPPERATPERAGVALVPEVYHLFDVIEYQGRVYASGSVRGPNDSAPGALMLSSDGLDFEVGPLFPADPGAAAWRLTYMVRFQDALFTGVEVLGGRGPDYVRWQKEPAEPALTFAHATPVWLTPSGDLSTLRWFSHGHRLYWIASGYDGTNLRASEDGLAWRPVALPEAAGAPLDLAHFGDALVLLTEHQLLTLPETGTPVVLAQIEEPSPFVLSDHYCSAPLAVFQGQLYAGGQRRGELYRFVPDSESGSRAASGTGLGKPAP